MSDKNKKEKDWIIRVRTTHSYHINKLKQNNKWRLSDTAKSLKRSIGSICEDLLVASWLRTHSHEIEKCDYLNEALIFIRAKKYEIQVGDD